MKKHSQLGLFKSKGRLNSEAVSKYRSPFQRDRDRIIHSKSFRRLKDKTQVFLAPYGDHFRTRLTHVLEVSQISRGIARTLGLHEDLAEAIALAHDLGHTPFGHAGQSSLNQCMKEYGGFEHNLQSLRIVDVLENDKLGRLSLSLNGCKERDRFILNTCHKNSIPVQVSMGGGYSAILKNIIEAHSNTFRLAQEIYF